MMNTFGTRGMPRIPARNETAWDMGREFVRLFGTVVYVLARKRGFGDAAAADLMREVLTHAARDEKRRAGDSGHNTIHALLITATQSVMAAVCSAKDDRPRRANGTGSTNTFEHGRTLDLNADWESEFQRQLARSAMGFVKREFPSLDWQAFWRTTVDGKTVAVVGQELGMTSGTVYVVKYRVLARLREEMHRLQFEVESWGDTSSWSADQPGDDVVRDPGRDRLSQTPIYMSAPDPEDVDRTSLHSPCFTKQG